MAANGLKTNIYRLLFSSHWQPFNFGWSNCLFLKHVSWLLSFSILLNIFRILAILFQKLAKTGGLEWLSHYNCTLAPARLICLQHTPRMLIQEYIVVYDMSFYYIVSRYTYFYKNYIVVCN